MRIILNSLFLILLLGCQKNADKITSAPITINGLSDFGRVVLGDQLDTVVLLDNTNSDNSESPSFLTESPFYIISVGPSSCAINFVPAKTLCGYKIRFLPSVVGQYKGEVHFKGTVALLYGQAISPGRLALSLSSIDVGGLTVGTTQTFPLVLSNIGDSDILYPNFTLPTEVSVLTNSCGAIIKSGVSCPITLQVKPILKSLTYKAAVAVNTSNGILFIDLHGRVRAGASSGNIEFTTDQTVPTLQVAQAGTNGITVLVSTAIIKDEFGNIVEDGTPVDVSVFRLKLLEDQSSFARTTLYTENGVVSFHIQAGTQIGTSSISAQTETSYGSIGIPIVN
jgi:hypothetical protein